MEKSKDLSSYTFHRELLPPNEWQKAPSIEAEIPFGQVHASHMLTCDFLSEQGGWQMPCIIPFQAFSIFPDSVAFHYGQQIFEGLKGYRHPENNRIFLFRPEKNAERFFHSAQRMAMQTVPKELFLAGINELVKVEQDFVLPQPGSLYIRPCLIPLDRGVSYRPSKNYRFFVILSAAKAYFANHTSVTVFVEEEMVRAVRGGFGDTKAGANYAGAALALLNAKNIGCDSVLWLDAVERRYVEEIGAMNVFFVYKDFLITPPLSGTILPGITRDSVITLARHLGYTVHEERIDINQAIADIKTGRITEAFGSGTAAIISPISNFIFRGETIGINCSNALGIGATIKQHLLNIQTGLGEDPFGWRVLVA